MFRLPTVSRQSLVLRFCHLAVDPCRFRGKIFVFIEPRVHPPINPAIHPSVIHHLSSSPLQVLKGGIAEYPIHTSPSSSKVRLHRLQPLHRVPKPSIESSIGSLIAIAPLPVLKRGIATDPRFNL